MRFLNNQGKYSESQLIYIFILAGISHYVHGQTPFSYILVGGKKSQTSQSHVTSS